MASKEQTMSREEALRKGAEELQQLRNRVVQLEMQEREHAMAVQVMEDLPKERRAFRLIGDVLVEQNVGTALDSVKGNLEMIQKTLEESAKRTLELERALTTGAEGASA